MDTAMAAAIFVAGIAVAVSQWLTGRYVRLLWLD